MKIFKITALSFILLFIYVIPVGAQNLNFIKAGDLKYTIASNSFFVVDGTSFVSLAGADANLYPSSEIYYLNSQGDVISFTELNPIPELVVWQSQASYINNIYILGGATGSLQPSSNVWRGKLNDNSNTSWELISTLPQPISLGSSIQYKGFVYFAGGYQNFDNEPTDSVYYSRIIDDGYLADWVPTSSLPLKSAGFTLVAYQDYLYALGKQDTPHVFSAKINSDGSLGAWEFTKSLPVNKYRASVVNVGNKIFVIGGIESHGFSPASSIYYSEILPSGQLTDWQYVEEFPRKQCCSPAIRVSNKIYVLGGHDGINYYKDVYKSTELNDNPTISTPTPTLSPIPTPTPSPIPVNKVVLIPGFGGSWNSDALLNCKLDNYEGGWSVSAFAKDIYEPVQKSITLNGKSVYVFTYDWRKDVRENAYKLREYVSSITLPTEKIDLLGHSMGGLVGREYVEESGYEKVNSFMSVGAPNHGMVRAYEVWSAGETVHENLLFRIAQFVLMKNCPSNNKNRREIVRENIPSIQNLLPVFDYIRDSFYTLKPYKNMDATNNWLPTDYLYLMHGVRVGTISGTGFPTLIEIKTKSPNKSDIKAGDWIDGKPTQMIRTKNGDNSVLISSSQLVGAENLIFRENHIGIISSKLPILNILRFFNISDNHVVESNNIPETNFAIVILAKNSELNINGQVSNDISVITNEKSGKYKLTVKPKGASSLLSVYQFLNDGKIVSTSYPLLNNLSSNWLIDFDLITPKPRTLIKL